MRAGGARPGGAPLALGAGAPLTGVEVPLGAPRGTPLKKKAITLGSGII